MERAQAEAGYGEQRHGVEPQTVEVRHRAKGFATGKEAILFWTGFAADDACDAFPLIYRIGIFLRNFPYTVDKGESVTSVIFEV